MAPLHTPELSQMRRRLRGLPHSAMLRTLQEQLETLSWAAMAADNTGRLIAANLRACGLTGYTRDELMHKGVKDLTPAMRQCSVTDRWSRFIQTGSQAGEYMLERKDGALVGVKYEAYASVAPGVHVSLIIPLEVPSSI